MLKILLVFQLGMQWSNCAYDITTAFQYAIRKSDDEPILVWPPEENFPLKTLVWRLKNAVDGLRAAPREWQHIFAEKLKPRAGRLKSDGNVYLHVVLTVIILVYVDGDPLHIQEVLSEIVLSLPHQRDKSLKRRRSQSQTHRAQLSKIQEMEYSTFADNA